jgi:DNA end-binding protein Ku
VPESDKTLSVSAFLDCGDIDDLFLDKPYYLAPADAHAGEAFALIREGMRKRNVAAIARTVLFRRVRTLLIRPHERGMIAETLNFDYAVRPAAEAFADIPRIDISDEMLDLAEHIIGKKRGRFDPAAFDDRYDAALAELVRAKIEGRAIKAPPAPREDKVIDLMAALRASADEGGAKTGKRSAAKAKPAPAGKRRKAG